MRTLAICVRRPSIARCIRISGRAPFIYAPDPPRTLHLSSGSGADRLSLRLNYTNSAYARSKPRVIRASHSTQPPAYAPQPQASTSQAEFEFDPRALYSNGNADGSTSGVHATNGSANGHVPGLAQRVADSKREKRTSKNALPPVPAQAAAPQTNGYASASTSSRDSRSHAHAGPPPSAGMQDSYARQQGGKVGRSPSAATQSSGYTQASGASGSSSYGTTNGGYTNVYNHPSSRAGTADSAYRPSTADSAYPAPAPPPRDYSVPSRSTTADSGYSTLPTSPTTGAMVDRDRLGFNQKPRAEVPMRRGPLIFAAQAQTQEPAPAAEVPVPAHERRPQPDGRSQVPAPERMRSPPAEIERMRFPPVERMRSPPAPVEPAAMAVPGFGQEYPSNRPTPTPPPSAPTPQPPSKSSTPTPQVPSKPGTPAPQPPSKPGTPTAPQRVLSPPTEAPQRVLSPPVDTAPKTRRSPLPQPPVGAAANGHAGAAVNGHAQEKRERKVSDAAERRRERKGSDAHRERERKNSDGQRERKNSDVQDPSPTTRTKKPAHLPLPSAEDVGLYPIIVPAPEHSPQPQTPQTPRKLDPALHVRPSSAHNHHTHATKPGTPPARVLTKPHRPSTPGSGTPSAPAKLDLPPELDRELDGLPLDDDPFAKAEVRVMPSPSREGSRKGSRDAQNNPDAAEAARAEFASAGASAAAEEKARKKSKRRMEKEQAQVLANGVQGLTPDPRAGSYRQPDQPHFAPQPSHTHHHHHHAMRREPGPFPLEAFLGEPALLGTLLSFMTFYDWCMLSSVSRRIRARFQEVRELREEVLERFLCGVGYARWVWEEREAMMLNLGDLNNYMRGVSMPTYQYARAADAFLQTLSLPRTEPAAQAAAETGRALRACARAYSRTVLRLRAQAEAEAREEPKKVAGPPPTRYKTPAGQGSRAPSPSGSMFSHGHSTAHGHGGYAGRASSEHGHGGGGARAPSAASHRSFRSPIVRVNRAPLLRVFVPSPDGDWLSDASVVECEAELKRAGATRLMRPGDVVWDLAVGDEGNVGRMVWDGSYLIDLDYTYSTMGDLPKYIHALAFSPSYFHRVIRTGTSGKESNPVVHLDISPWGEEIMANMQLLQDRVRTETPQGGRHNVVRWMHRSSFFIRPPAAARAPYGTNPRQVLRIPIPGTDGLFVDPGWYGTVIVEAEGTNEGLADLRDRCMRRPPVKPGQQRPQEREERTVYRVLREKSRPKEIWIRTVREKERLM